MKAINWFFLARWDEGEERAEDLPFLAQVRLKR